MEFSSLPLYQDPPNWPLQQDLQQGGPRDHHASSDQLPPPPARPGSMAEKARLAKLPQPAEPSQLKCPRCESTNTKFCYFNNYNLTQPRHFCKTCRRYWTRGGALRSVPVGGGCRRNKRSKPKAPSKSPLNITISSSPNTSATVVSSSNPSHHPQSSQIHMPFFHPHLQNLSDFGNNSSSINGAGFGQLHEFQNGVMNISNMPVNLSARFADLWRGQPQFPFLAAAGLEQFQAGAHVDQFGHRMVGSESAADSVKQEGRNILSINPGNEETSYWGSGNMNAWNPDLSAGSTSTTTYLL